MKSAINDELQRRAASLDGQSSCSRSQVSAEREISSKAGDSVSILADFDDWVVVSKPAYMSVSVDGDLSSTRESHSEEDSPDDASKTDCVPDMARWVSLNLCGRISTDRLHAHGILHRLDLLTSGALLVAKTYKGFYDLRVQFATGKIGKEYVALVHGRVTGELRMSERLHVSHVFDSLGKPVASKTQVVTQGGKPALTIAKVSKLYDSYTLLSVQIFTGRTHQIRAHLAHAGYPIVGDFKYGDAVGNPITKRTFLHCSALSFNSADQHNIRVEAPLPDDLKLTLSLI